ncbi:transcription factor FapR [Effusibacillus dendaii]|uniref:Transcription factor FapR n=2 Tax=Effusibacillus dendaii TaxID=2743772 RepID=A0A7I8D4V3_9BACL|nr:transcription factor FapR [Effusibacillus dendaii]
MAGMSKKERQTALLRLLEEQPFITDEALAGKFQVSIQTIRLDRLALGIPEVRERIKAVAEQKQTDLRSLEGTEVIGQLIELNLNEMAISILDIEPAHVFSKTKIVRGHHLFAQANSLAVAVIDADVVLTRTANIRFVRSGRLGERLVCKAVVTSNQTDRAHVEVTTRVGEDIVFFGKFIVVKMALDTMIGGG